MTERPAKTLISLGIRPVWSEFSLCAQWVAKNSRFLHAASEDSDQTERMPRLIWVFAGRTTTLLVLSCRGSYYLHPCHPLRSLSFLSASYPVNQDLGKPIYSITTNNDPYKIVWSMWINVCIATLILVFEDMEDNKFGIKERSHVDILIMHLLASQFRRH